MMEAVYVKIAGGDLWCVILHWRPGRPMEYSAGELAAVPRRIVFARMRRDAVDPGMIIGANWKRAALDADRGIVGFQHRDTGMMPWYRQYLDDLLNDVIGRSGGLRPTVPHVVRAMHQVASLTDDVVRHDEDRPVADTTFVWHCTPLRVSTRNVQYVARFPAMPILADGVQGAVSIECDSLQIGVFTHPDYDPLRWGILLVQRNGEIADRYLMAQCRLHGALEAYTLCPVFSRPSAMWSQHDDLEIVPHPAAPMLRLTADALRIIARDDAMSSPVPRKHTMRPRQVRPLILSAPVADGSRPLRIDRAQSDLAQTGLPLDALRVAVNLEYVVPLLQTMPMRHGVMITVGRSADERMKRWQMYVVFDFGDGVQMIVACMHLPRHTLGEVDATGRRRMEYATGRPPALITQEGAP